MLGRKWKEEEIEYLYKYYGSRSLKQMSRHLKKSESAIMRKAIREGIGNQMSAGELLTKAEVSRLVGVHPDCITKWWFSRGLTYIKLDKFVKIKYENLIRFMKAHPDLWDARKCDYWTFQQYDWFLKKLEEDRKKSGYRTHRWTDKEWAKAQMLKQRGMPDEEIAAELGLTLNSVKSKFNYERRVAREKARLMKEFSND